MKEIITYYILFAIFLMTLLSVAGAGLAVFSQGTVAGLIGVIVAALPALAWTWWMAYVMKDCAGKQNWVMAD